MSHQTFFQENMSDFGSLVRGNHFNTLVNIILHNNTLTVAYLKRRKYGSSDVFPGEHVHRHLISASWFEVSDFIYEPAVYPTITH